ncbi:MAG: hypothetical protein LUC26_03065 [Prevotella sp.]|nr:hypothetical protein [Prevotella sp.]
MNRFLSFFISALFALYAYCGRAQIGNVYHVTSSNDGSIVSGFHSFASASDEKIFASALLWATENISPAGREGIDDINISAKSFAADLTLSSASSKSANTYRCHAQLQAGDGKLLFLLSNIKVETSSMVLLSKEIAFEKLQPEKKDAHKAIIKEFEQLGSDFINKLVNYIETKYLPAITHWDEIANGKVAVGMSEEECKLAFGKPNSVTVSGDETQWMYPGSFYIFFKDGAVSSFIK